jgi:hypothetical protein
MTLIQIRQNFLVLEVCEIERLKRMFTIFNCGIFPPGLQEQLIAPLTSSVKR